ncbi:hypothetical protein L0337_42255 [candidate division KSB1 bacterium]|nr:hypothetical protein [candidate division KSB1 bacterium]
MSKKFVCAVCLVAVFFNGPVPAPSQHLSAAIREALTHVSAGSLYQHLSFLGSDSLKGRGTGTRGGEIAAAYIARELRKCGIKPAGGDDSYFQQIPLHGSKPLASSSFQFFTPNGQFQLTLGRDYLLYNTGAQTFIPKPAADVCGIRHLGAGVCL